MVLCNFLTCTPQKSCADVVSVLGMTMADDPEYKHDTLKFRLLGKHEQLGVWGHEYIRHLRNQIIDIWVEQDLSRSESSEGNVYSYNVKR